MHATTRLADHAPTPGAAPGSCEPAPGADELTDRLTRFVRLLMRPGRGHAFAAMAQHDLSVSQVRILHLLASGDHSPAQVEIAEQIDLSEAAAGRAVDALVRARLAERTADPEDRRVKRVALTTAGRQMIDDMAAARRADVAAFVGQLEEVERQALDAALASILAARADDDADALLGGCSP